MSLRPGGLVVASAFFLVAVALGGTLPLWLDEIIQLRLTKDTSPGQLIAALPGQPGATPLGYLTQQASLRVTGYSARAARLPSAIFTAGAVYLVAAVACELGLASPWVASLIFALFPLTLRYGDESRIYSQALFFSVLATLFFVRFVSKSNPLTAFYYGLALTAAIYTQPYAIFIAPAHILWNLRDRRSTLMSLGALGGAVAAFLPWYIWSKHQWSAGIASGGVRFVISAKTPLMLFRELAGAGYWGSGLLLILCIVAVKKRDRTVSFLTLLIGVPIALALVADAVFGYFIATRQILWVLPAVAIFAALAIERSPRVAIPAAAILAAICIVQSFRYFTAPKEDWQAAANILAKEVGQGACLVVVPPDQQYPYEFFRPDLAHSQCPAPRTVVSATPYATADQRASAFSTLSAQGYSRQSETEAGKSDIALFTR